MLIEKSSWLKSVGAKDGILTGPVIYLQNEGKTVIITLSIPSGPRAYE